MRIVTAIAGALAVLAGCGDDAPPTAPSAARPDLLPRPGDDASAGGSAATALSTDGVAMLGRHEWTLDAILLDDGTVEPQHPGRSERFRFLRSDADAAAGRLEAEVLCRSLEGGWSLSDGALVVAAESTRQDDCDRHVSPGDPALAVLDRAFGGEPMLADVTEGRLTLVLATNERLLFSGRETVAGERRPVVRRLEEGDAAGQGLDSIARRVAVHRDQASLDALYPTLYAEPVRPRGPVPTVNFDTTIVVGAFLDIQGTGGRDVTVEHTVETDEGLEIGIRYREFLGDDPVTCEATDAPSGPYELVAVESVVQPLRFTERTVGACSGVEASRFEDLR